MQLAAPNPPFKQSTHEAWDQGELTSRVSAADLAGRDVQDRPVTHQEAYQHDEAQAGADPPETVGDLAEKLARPAANAC